MTIKEKNIWKEANKVGVSVVDERTIYRGVIFQLSDEGNTLSICEQKGDFYVDVPDEIYNTFVEDSFVDGIKACINRKFNKKLDRLNKLIKRELTGNKNQRKIKNLKEMRNELHKERRRALEK